MSHRYHRTKNQSESINISRIGTEIKDLENTLSIINGDRSCKQKGLNSATCVRVEESEVTLY